MFNTMHVAEQIRNARISQNMTQMNLADAMEVSYQAVSNWERGNSMPDISKLEQLCSILKISMDDLLGTESASKALIKIIKPEESHMDSNDAQTPITLEEIHEVAPLIPPIAMEKLVDENIRAQKDGINLSAIFGIAPFLEKSYVDDLVNKAQFKSLCELRCLIPFLSRQTLDDLAKKADLHSDMAGLESVAPFLCQSTLEEIILGQEELWKNNLKIIRNLFPFLSKSTLEMLAWRADWESGAPELMMLAPFLSKDTLKKLVTEKIPLENIQLMRRLAPFTDKETLETLVYQYMEMPAMANKLSCFYPFLSQQTLKDIAQKLIEKDDMQEH